jgi:hypothetical protein
LVAALHVFIYAAALPFFSNVDEVAHFDTVLKYSHGHVPRGLELCSQEMIRDQVLFDSRAYFTTTNEPQLDTPPWKWPFKAQVEWIALHTPVNTPTNYEATQPPLYYACAGGWWRLAGALNVREDNRLYGIHFLNVPVVVLAVWVGWLVARRVFPANPFRRLAVPAFMALIPQPAFYAIQNDAFSPLLFGLAFLGLLRPWTTEVPSVGLGILTGLALAATFLTKITNTFPIIVIMVTLAVLAHNRWRQGTLGKAVPSFLALCFCAGVPALAWMIWCKLHYGDLTGSKLKAVYWTWTPKPFLQWWHHPIFTPFGACRFLYNFLEQFWEGELIWHFHAMRFLTANIVYAVASAGLLLVALAKITLRRASVPAFQREVLWTSFWVFASAILFLVYISISFNFNECPNPTPADPYLYSGRQALAALVPFMLLFVSGLDMALGRLADRAKYVVLALLLVMMASVEAASDWPMFSNPFNWFHL